MDFGPVGVLLGLSNILLALAVFALVLVPIACLPRGLRELLALTLALAPAAGSVGVAWQIYEEFNDLLPTWWQVTWPLLLTGGLSSLGCLVCAGMGLGRAPHWPVRRLLWLVIAAGFLTTALLWLEAKTLREQALADQRRRWQDIWDCPGADPDQLADLSRAITPLLNALPKDFSEDRYPFAQTTTADWQDASWDTYFAARKELIDLLIKASEASGCEILGREQLYPLAVGTSEEWIEHSELQLRRAYYLLRGYSDLLRARGQLAEAVPVANALNRLLHAHALSIGLWLEGAGDALPSADPTLLLISDLEHHQTALAGLEPAAPDAVRTSVRLFVRAMFSISAGEWASVAEQDSQIPEMLRNSVVYEVLVRHRGPFLLRDVERLMADGLSRPWHQVQTIDDPSGMVVITLKEMRPIQAWAMLRETAIALVRYQDAHQADPPDLAALVPDYLPEVPLEPYTGTALTLQAEDTHLVIGYSSSKPTGTAGETGAMRVVRFQKRGTIPLD